MSEAIQQQRKPLTIRDRLESEEFKSAVAKALPKHLTPDRFVRIACTAIMRTPKLMQCDQTSFFNALLTLSQLGIEPDGRRAHLIPFENRKRGVTEVQLIIDYKGLVELVMRSGMVANLHADVVCASDEFEYDIGQIARHKIDFKKPRGPVYAVYCIARFKDGTSKTDVMTTDEVEAIRSRSRAAQAGPWVTDWNEMAKKTVFRRLSKWLPLSPEFRDVIEADEDAPIEIQSSADKATFDMALGPDLSEKDEKLDKELPAAPPQPPVVGEQNTVSEPVVPASPPAAAPTTARKKKAAPVPETPSAEVPASAAKQVTPVPTEPVEEPTITLARKLDENGVSIDDFFDWLKSSGRDNVYKFDADTVETMNDLPPKLVSDLLLDDTGLNICIRIFGKKKA